MTDNLEGFPEPEWLGQPANTSEVQFLRTVEDYTAAAERLAPVDVKTQQGLTLRLGEQSEMTLVWGRAGVGKTWATLWMAERLAVKGIRSVIMVTEGFPSYIGRLPKTDGSGYKWPNNLLPSIGRITRSDLKYPRNQDIIREAENCGAVFLDVVSALFSDFDENSSSAWNTTRELLNPIIGDRLFVAVHHSGKAGNAPSTRYPESPRGTSRLIDDAAYDYVIAAGNEPGTMKMKAGSKSRGANEPFDQEILFRFKTSGVEEIGTRDIYDRNAF